MKEMISNTWIPTITSIILAIFAVLMIFRRRKSSSTMEWPVGPKTLPIIGNLHNLGGAAALHVVLHKLAQVYGSVMTIWIGSWKPVIVVSDFDQAWEVLVNKSSDYSSREMPEITKIVTENWRTIVNSDTGPCWATLKKGLHTVALSPQNIAFQTALQEEDIKEAVRLIRRLIYGKDFNDGKYVKSMHDEIEFLTHFGSYPQLTDVFYYAKYLPSYKRAVKAMVRPFLASNPPTNTYLHFLKSQNYPEDVIVFAIYEAYLLGVDSTSTTTTWALAFLMREPSVQEKLYQDLKNFTADNNRTMLKVEDVNKLPYLQAVVKETMRMKPIAPLAIPHKECKDKVDKGNNIMVNIHSLHHTEKVWREPYRFMPESAGMRICAGMELGKLQFSFSLANLVKAFKWYCASDGVLPDISDRLSGFVRFSKTPLEARIVPRV
ncbi:hypothetical protein MKX03_028096 [Papaver bracteatum]|nr:hypothetical protein MKX03_028096 [Papaver bracteatum]